MKATGIAAWIISELAMFSVAIYAFKNPTQVAALINSTATGIGGLTRAFEGRPQG